jgi:hypothetical protein
MTKIKVSRRAKRRNRFWRLGAALLFLLSLTGAAFHIIRSLSTQAWPTVNCVVRASRVTSSQLENTGRGIVFMYRGQYQLEYEVNGNYFYVWGDANVMDPDKSFVEGKIQNLPEHCNFKVQYNPRNPKEALATLLQPN